MKLILDLIAPHHCLNCSLEGQLVCQNCLKLLSGYKSCCAFCLRPTVNYRVCPNHNSQLNNLYCLTSYGGLAKDLVYKMKFNYSKDSAKLIADLLYAQFELQIQQLEVITYIPTATTRVRGRGFDQSLIIAKHLSKLSGKPFVKSLVRLDQSRSVGSSKTERINRQQYKLINNLEGAVLLVDDVTTTGYTFKTAVKLLKNDQNQLYGLAFAKTLLK